MLIRLRKLVPHHFPPRIWYHHLRSFVANVRYGFPSRGMRVTGITGTNGKTTTTTLVASMLAASGKKVAMASTIQFRIGDRIWVNESHKTTLSPEKFQAFIREAKDAGCNELVLEVSSHALDQGRVAGVNITTAVFTNLSPEHLDYHKTMDAYSLAKQQLFQRLRGRPATRSIVNGNDPRAADFLAHPAEESWVAVTEDAHIDPQRLGRPVTVLRAHSIETLPTLTRFVLHWNDHELQIAMQLLGKFNVENATVAAATALALGAEPSDVQAVLESVEVIPGRLEPVDVGQPFRALIDYAVTPDSLEKLYDTLRPITTGKIIAVFGACGDRDRTKRPAMGQAGGEKADILIITTEEPYTEDPQQIIDDLTTGARRTTKVEGADFFIIPDRRAAIDHAVSLARPGDTIVLSGMGDETSMVWGTKAIPWSDREELRESLRRHGAA